MHSLNKNPLQLWITYSHVCLAIFEHLMNAIVIVEMI